MKPKQAIAGDAREEAMNRTSPRICMEKFAKAVARRSTLSTKSAVPRRPTMAADVVRLTIHPAATVPIAGARRAT
jgi:hypothetical protein